MPFFGKDVSTITRQAPSQAPAASSAWPASSSRTCKSSRPWELGRPAGPSSRSTPRRSAGRWRRMAPTKPTPRRRWKAAWNPSTTTTRTRALLRSLPEGLLRPADRVRELRRAEKLLWPSVTAALRPGVTARLGHLGAGAGGQRASRVSPRVPSGWRRATRGTLQAVRARLCREEGTRSNDHRLRGITAGSWWRWIVGKRISGTVKDPRTKGIQVRVRDIQITIPT